MFNPPYDASTYIPYMQLALELIRSLAWPISVVILAFIFRDKIKPLVHSIQSVGPHGVTFKEAPEQIKPPTETPNELVVGAVQPELNNSVAEDIRRSVTMEVTQLPEDQRESALINGLTYRILEKYLFRAYVGIFGSQIDILDRLNARDMQESEVKALFSRTQAEYEPLKSWTIEEYMAYLINWKFVDERDGIFRITQNGRDFLTFLATHALSRHMPL